MRSKLSKIISAVIILSMVITSTGLAFADKNETFGKVMPNVNRQCKPIHNPLSEKQEPEKNPKVDKISETLRDLYTNGNGFGKMKANRAEADEVAAVIGTTEYLTLQDALDNAVNGDVITVTKAIVPEAIEIDPGQDSSLTIDFDGASISALTENTIVVYSGDITIMNAEIDNFMKPTGSDAVPTGVYALDAKVTLQNCIACTSGNNSVGFYADEGTYMTLKDCCYIDSTVAGLPGDTLPVDVAGVLVGTGGNVSMTECITETAYGDGIVAFGNADINNCYMVAEEEGHCAMVILDGGKITVNDGYYYGDTAVWLTDAKSYVTIKRGEFVSMYEECSAIANSFDDESFGTNVKISTGCKSAPSDWRTYGADSIYVYKKYPAPTTVTPKLYKKYNGVALSWSKVQGAKAYRVYFKRSTTSKYVLLKTTTATSITKTGLYAGAKYQFKVYACDKLDVTSVPYYGNGNYKLSTIYTLKKLKTPTVARTSNSYVKVKWNNISGETGYQISRSTSKAGTNIVYTYKTTSASSKTIKAARGKVYYYKVRAYKTVDGKKIYAPWSPVRTY